VALLLEEFRDELTEPACDLAPSWTMAELEILLLNVLKHTVMGGVREPIRLCSLRSPIDVRGSEWNDVLQRVVFDLRYDSNSVHMAAKLEIFHLLQHVSLLPGVVSDAILRPR